MIIAVEGADGCGKTTMAELISDHTGLPIIPYYEKMGGGESRDELEKLIFVQLSEAVPLSPHFNFIRDRFLMTAMVYSRLFGSHQYWVNYLKLIEEADVFFVYIDTSVDLLMKRIERRELLGHEKEVKEILSNLSIISALFDLVFCTIKEKMPKKIMRLDGRKSIKDLGEDFRKHELSNLR